MKPCSSEVTSVELGFSQYKAEQQLQPKKPSSLRQKPPWLKIPDSQPVSAQVSYGKETWSVNTRKPGWREQIIPFKRLLCPSAASPGLSQPQLLTAEGTGGQFLPTALTSAFATFASRHAASSRQHLLFKPLRMFEHSQAHRTVAGEKLLAVA